VPTRSLQPTAVHVQRWQADALSQEEGMGSVQSKNSHSANQDNASLSLEHAWHVSPDWMQDLNGEDQATASGHQQLEKLNQNLSDYYAS
ncbi:type VI secretion system tip protein VgrG, partial [Acinetobacter sp. 11520]|nr:type VI secretion system tip protein VgrG [Acinetobacter sp. 11520]